MSRIPYSNLAKGTLLIAAPDLDTGLFFRSVVLICEHNPTGSFGLILNKPVDMDLPSEIVNISTLANPRISMRAGGIIHTNQMMLLHSSPAFEGQTLEICENVFLGGDPDFLQKSIENPEGPSIRLCFGYSGWGPGQLERELLCGNWFLLPASEEHVFGMEPSKMWRLTLRNMGGKFANLSMIPEDLSLN